MKKKGLRRILILGLVAVLGFGWFAAYRAVNRWYEPLIIPTNTVTYEMGQWVPIGPQPENILQPDGWSGYSYQLHDWKIMDTDAFLEEYQLQPHWQEEDIKPEKMLVATVTVANENNALMDFSLFQLTVKTELSTTFLDEVLCAELNEGVEYPANISVALTEEVTLTLPYGLRRESYSAGHWRNIEQLPFYMTFSMVNENWEERIVPLN